MNGVLLQLILAIGGCSDTKFASSAQKGAKPKAKEKATEATAATEGTLAFSFDIIAGAKTLNLSATFAKVENKSNPAQDHKTEYTLIPESFIATAAGGFSEELAAQIKKAPLTAVETFTAMPTASHSLEVTMDLKGLVVDGKDVPAQKLVLTQVSAAEDWNKEEPNVTAFGQLGATVAQGAACVLEKSGENPHNGVYSVVLTKPAPCDFKLPTVNVGRGSVRNEIEIGTYWKIPKTSIAHSFPLGPTSPGVGIDNGFILIQPDGKSYLLVDAGYAFPSHSNYKSAAAVASMQSKTLGYGETTTLLQPIAGSASDNFATSTLFKKGSVIALYDDTPDMGGSIDVTALVQSAVSTSAGFKWTARFGPYTIS